MISIVTTFFNTEKYYLDKLCDSIINQTFTNWEWVVTDDWSVDPAHTELVKALPSRDKRIRYVEQKFKKEVFWNPQTYAKGDIVTQVDSDDWLVPKSLEVLDHFYTKYPDVVVITTEISNFKEGGSYRGATYLNFENYRSIYDYIIGNENDTSIKKQCISDMFFLGYLRSWRNINIDFNPGNKYNVKLIVNDYVQLTRIEEFGKYIHIPRPLYMYNTREDSISRKKDEFNDFNGYTVDINEEIRSRREGKEVNSVKRIFEPIFYESTAFFDNAITFEKDTKTISFMSPTTLKLIQKEALKELYFDHKLYFNDISMEPDYIILQLTYNDQFESFKEIFEKMRPLRGKSKLSVQVTHKDPKMENDLFKKIVEHVRGFGYGFCWSEYNNHYNNINIF